MPAYSGVDQNPYPLGGELPDGPGAFLALAQRLTALKGAGIGYAVNNSTRVALQSPDPVTGLVAVFPGLVVYDAQDDVYYKWTGTTWIVYQQDTGWLSTATQFTVASGWTAGNNLAVRIRNGIVYWRGQIVAGTSTFPAATSVTPVTVNAGYRPANDFYGGVDGASNNNNGRIQIPAATGIITVQTVTAIATNGFVSMDNVSYSLT